MSRLIDADALVELWKGCTFNGDITPIIANAPTIEPEQKIGKWMFDEERGATGIYAICSACDESIYQTGDFKYCPNCGAYMKGEPNED